jgi:hypothetical protein
LVYRHEIHRFGGNRSLPAVDDRDLTGVGLCRSPDWQNTSADVALVEQV